MDLKKLQLKERTVNDPDLAESYEGIEMFRLGILHAELDNFLDTGKCLINGFSEGMAALELGGGYDEDPLLIGLDNDGNTNRFHVQIIIIPALMLFLGAHASYLTGIMYRISKQ
jgi:hypothetical protein